MRQHRKRSDGNSYWRIFEGHFVADIHKEAFKRRDEEEMAGC